MVAINLEPAHGWVIAAVAGSVAVHHLYMSFGVGKARKKYGVKYPTLYADESKGEGGKAYNCVQRGHQNSLEMLPTFYALTLVAGARYPLSAAAMAAVYLLGRVLYFQGYCSGDPKERTRGTPFYGIASLALLGMCISFAVELIRA